MCFSCARGALLGVDDDGRCAERPPYSILSAGAGRFIPGAAVARDRGADVEDSDSITCPRGVVGETRTTHYARTVVHHGRCDPKLRRVARWTGGFVGPTTHASGGSAAGWLLSPSARCLRPRCSFLPRRRRARCARRAGRRPGGDGLLLRAASSPSRTSRCPTSTVTCRRRRLRGRDRHRRRRPLAPLRAGEGRLHARGRRVDAARGRDRRGRDTPQEVEFGLTGSMIINLLPRRGRATPTSLLRSAARCG